MSYWEDVRKEHVQIINSGHHEHGIWAEGVTIEPDIDPELEDQASRGELFISLGALPVLAIIAAVFTDWALLWVYGPLAVLGMVGLLCLAGEEDSGTTETWTSGEEYRS